MYAYIGHKIQDMLKHMGWIPESEILSVFCY